MITFRALPFSLLLLLHMLVAYPLIIAFCAALGLPAALFAGLLWLLFPPAIVIIVVTIFLFATSVLPVLVALRQGLVIKGIKPLNTYLQLVWPMFTYGFIIGFVLTFIVMGGIGYFIWQAGLTMEDYALYQDPRQRNIVSAKLLAQTPLAIRVSVVVFVLTCSFLAAILIPLAGASVGRDLNGQRHTPFFGFGTGFVPLIVLVVLGMAITVMSNEIAIWIASLVGAEDAARGALQFEQLLRNSDFDPNWKLKLGLGLLATTTIGIFAMCIYCAGAILVYIEATQIVENSLPEPEVVRSTPRMTSDEVHAMWKDRMPRLDDE
ncbi:MAG: hypothetical protein AAFP98_07640 [Pseudomonadota bacterium]